MNLLFANESIEAMKQYLLLLLLGLLLAVGCRQSEPPPTKSEQPSGIDENKNPTQSGIADSSGNESVASAAVSCSQRQEEGLADYFGKLHKDKKFNGNVLIVGSGKELYRNSFGFAKGDASEKLTQEHLFQIGSIYKEFPAVAIMQLKEKGLLSLDDKLSQFVHELPEWAESVKINHLLQFG